MDNRSLFQGDPAYLVIPIIVEDHEMKTVDEMASIYIQHPLEIENH